MSYGFQNYRILKQLFSYKFPIYYITIRGQSIYIDFEKYWSFFFVNVLCVPKKEYILQWITHSHFYLHYFPLSHWKA